MERKEISGRTRIGFSWKAYHSDPTLTGPGTLYTIRQLERGEHIDKAVREHAAAKAYFLNGRRISEFVFSEYDNDCRRTFERNYGNPDENEGTCIAVVVE